MNRHALSFVLACAAFASSPAQADLECQKTGGRGASGTLILESLPATESQAAKSSALIDPGPGLDKTFLSGTFKVKSQSVLQTVIEHALVSTTGAEALVTVVSRTGRGGETISATVQQGEVTEKYFCDTFFQ